MLPGTNSMNGPCTPECNSRIHHQSNSLIYLEYCAAVAWYMDTVAVSRNMYTVAVAWYMDAFAVSRNTDIVAVARSMDAFAVSRNTDTVAVARSMDAVTVQ